MLKFKWEYLIWKVFDMDLILKEVKGTLRNLKIIEVFHYKKYKYEIV